MRTNAAWALGEMNVYSDMVVPALTRTLGDNKDHVRLSATAALYGFGSKAIQSIQALKSLLKDQNEVVRETASLVLDHLEKSGANVPKAK